MLTAHPLQVRYSVEGMTELGDTLIACHSTMLLYPFSGNPPAPFEEVYETGRMCEAVARKATKSAPIYPAMMLTMPDELLRHAMPLAKELYMVLLKIGRVDTHSDLENQQLPGQKERSIAKFIQATGRIMRLIQMIILLLSQ
jgi:hypothetical protein